MKKIHVTQEFHVGLAKLLAAREERYKHLDKFPELKHVHVVSEERNGHILKQERHISIADSLPSVLATVMPAGAATLIEKSEFDDNTNVHTFTVVPGGGNDHLFQVKGISRYFTRDDGKGGREYDIEVTSNAFLISGLVETAIAELYARNIEKDHDSIEGFIKMLEEEEAKKSAG